MRIIITFACVFTNSSLNIMNEYLKSFLLFLFLAVTPHIWGVTKTSTLTFTSAELSDNTITADDGVVWTVEASSSSNGPYYENEEQGGRGLYYSNVNYVNFKTNGISGKIKKITAQAAGYDNSNYNWSFITIHVNGNNILENTHLSTSLKSYSCSLDTELTSEIYIELFCNKLKNSPGLYMKSIEVEYETDEPEIVDVNFKEAFGGWSSLYYQNKSLVVPEDVTAYTYSVTGDVGSTSDTYAPGEVIPQNTAVILKLNDGYGTFDETGIRKVSFEVTQQSGESDADNQLLGFDEPSPTTGPGGEADGYEFFRLTLNARGESGSIGFYWGGENGGSFTVGGHKAYLAIPKSTGSPHPSNLSIKVIPTIMGDANNDGFVNVTDVMMVVNHLLGKPTHNIKLKKADFNQDGNVNVTDVMSIVNHILGFSSEQ